MFKRKRTAIAVTVVSLGLVGLGASSAVALTQHDVRQSDFDATNSSAPGLKDTRSAGHFSFLKEGLHVYTDDATSNAKAAEYYAAPAGSSLPTGGSYDWYGTEPGASDQIVFDADSTSGNGNDFNILVGEQIYSGAGDGDNLTDW